VALLLPLFFLEQVKNAIKNGTCAPFCERVKPALWLSLPLSDSLSLSLVREDFSVLVKIYVDIAKNIMLL
jgi:hypothetical protein